MQLNENFEKHMETVLQNPRLDICLAYPKLMKMHMLGICDDLVTINRRRSPLLLGFRNSYIDPSKSTHTEIAARSIRLITL